MRTAAMHPADTCRYDQYGHTNGRLTGKRRHQGNCQKNKRPSARSPIAQQTNRYEAGAAAPTLSPHRRPHITPKQPGPPTDSACATPAVPYTGIITAPSAIIPAINTSNAARSISHVFLTAATSAADMPGSDHAIIGRHKRRQRRKRQTHAGTDQRRQSNRHGRQWQRNKLRGQTQYRQQCHPRRLHASRQHSSSIIQRPDNHVPACPISCIRSVWCHTSADRTAGTRQSHRRTTVHCLPR